MSEKKVARVATDGGRQISASGGLLLTVPASDGRESLRWLEGVTQESSRESSSSR